MSQQTQATSTLTSIKVVIAVCVLVFGFGVLTFFQTPETTEYTFNYLQPPKKAITYTNITYGTVYNGSESWNETFSKFETILIFANTSAVNFSQAYIALGMENEGVYSISTPTDYTRFRLLVISFTTANRSTSLWIPRSTTISGNFTFAMVFFRYYYDTSEFYVRYAINGVPTSVYYPES